MNASNIERTRCFRDLAPSNKIPAKGKKTAKSCGAIHGRPAFCKEAEADGTVTASANGTELLLGVMIVIVWPFCEKTHVAPAGKELGRQDSVMGWLGLPVLAFKDSE
jgi:hypothetical protein